MNSYARVLYQVARRLRAASKRSDFVSMGWGIEGRYQRCQGWWEPHLAYTREFVSARVPRCGAVAVLGAGRLLDLDLAHLLSVAERVDLFDADPGVLKRWKTIAGAQYGKRVTGHILDLTECLDEWTRGYTAAFKRGVGASFLRSCQVPVPSSWVRGEYSGYISLNLLGQIPLYWRDRVLRIGCEDHNALIDSMAALQVAHLKALEQDNKAWSIVISDTEYYFYHVDSAQWRVEPALFGVAADTFKASIANLDSEAWLWHIAPQFVENDLEGEIHRVEAYFSRSPSAYP